MYDMAANISLTIAEMKVKMLAASNDEREVDESANV